MDKALRNALRSAVVACRQVLEEDVRGQLEGRYGVTPKGEFLVAEEFAPYGDETVPAARASILDAIGHIESYGMPRKDAVGQFVRETAFTHLNRLAALKLMEHESRGLILESIGRGKESKGFLLLQKVSPEACRAAKNGGVLDGGYRLYLECLCDDLATELGVLFDRHLPQSIIFPSDRCLRKILDILNGAEIASVWGEDETIGWIYQYFTPKELRDKARKESGAPRNSYELAFRNQFYTPRYVVQFLVDNTLGRIWYEMHQGNTRLKNECRYLVYQPDEVFLGPDCQPPVSSPQPPVSSPQPPILIPHRAKKDPRDLKVLDPASGSAHFLLYSFDVLETIYEECWADEHAPASVLTGKTLCEDYPDLESLRRAVPVLILQHNLHGIDIDLRATQIAAMALWLRAQRSFQRLGLKVGERPRITRSNIVCAEPMPGERELLEEFTAGLEPKLLGELVRRVFDSMKLAGEAGSLLKIEEELRDDIARAKQQWLKRPKKEQLTLFPEPERRKAEQMPLFDLSGITDDKFWEDAEDRVVEELREYAGRATNGKGYLRRLFADDAERGFAFIHVCRQRFDVVLMNPPFGDASLPSLGLLDDQLARCGRNIGPAFVAAAGDRWAPEGYVGVLLSTAPLFQPSASRWRGDHLLGERRSLAMVAHLGGDVLDEAKVGASASVTRPTIARSSAIPFFRLLRTKDRRTALLECISTLRNSEVDGRVYFASVASLRRLPGWPLAYWISDGLRERLASLPKFEGAGGTVKQGTATAEEFRFSRAWWEVAGEATGRKWLPFTKGSEYCPFWDEPTWVVNFANGGEEIRATGRARVQGTEYFGRPGVTFPSRSVPGFNPRVHPSGSAFSHTGAVAFPTANTPATLLGYLASRPVEYVLSLFVGSLQGDDFHPNHYEVGLVSRIPWPGLTDESARTLASAASEAAGLALSLFEVDETAHHFLAPCGLKELSLKSAARAWRTHEVETVRRVDAVRTSIDGTVGETLGFSPRDMEEMIAEFDARIGPSSGRWRPYFSAEPDAPDAREAAEILFSYAVGVAFGRWDVRLATGKQSAPELPDPFAPLPVCSPGMLTDPNGMPARKAPPSYPLRIDWDGILTDDPGPDSNSPHQDDIVRRVREVLEVMFADRHEAIEKEACEILGVKALREYFRNPSLFFGDHIKRYSKSRRRAPIYWLLQSSKRSYGLWLYYHRLDRDTVFKALRNCVLPKINGETTRLREMTDSLEQDKDALPQSQRTRRERAIDKQEALLTELTAFKEALERVAALGYDPDLNDGVVLNIAPFHEITPWKVAKQYWDELCEGKYEWSTMSKRLREKGLVSGG